jgi:peroxiredoxin
VLSVFAGGVCAANVKGMVAKARAIASTVVFISLFSLAGLTARSQFHLAANGEKPR